MNPARHSIHILSLYAVLLLPMHFTYPSESVCSTPEGLGDVVLSRRVVSAPGCIKNSESCHGGISHDVTGTSCSGNASCTKYVGTSLTWPMGLSSGAAGSSLAGTSISSLSGCGS